ncbi:hypothetical protein EW026_g6608 [Hermanssonia centrifuga]|uniref:Diaminopimelate epimerase-like protein n=1 Tax=Hermanssonia centrifuga TaxID=98765 RepID=A0A4S4KAG1_9APHY|nr:hypothetical protein EW026_g6608 [Hermanssonia centrifuga]
MALPFYIVNAFTTNPYGGNPAGVVLLKEPLETEILQQIAKNFNQPMVSFIWPVAEDLSHDPRSAIFNIRWFNASLEVPLCGHASLATAGALFALNLLPPMVNTVRFQTTTGRVVSASRTGDWVELSLAAATTRVPSQDEVDRLTKITRRGLGKDVTVNYVGIGGEGFESYVMVEIDQADDLAGCKPDPGAFLETGYTVNIVTSSSSDSDVNFVSRMFAPAASATIPEDPVCGSAHCLLTPYWAHKLDLNDAPMVAKQVSERGGDLRVRWRGPEKLISLGGQSRITMKGDLLL